MALILTAEEGGEELGLRVLKEPPKAEEEVALKKRLTKAFVIQAGAVASCLLVGAALASMRKNEVWGLHSQESCGDSLLKEQQV